MDINYYKNQLHKLEEVSEKSADRQLSFFQSLLIVSVTLLGILVSLHDNTTDILSLRLLYALSIVLLSLGILSCATVLYDLSMALEKNRREFANEAQKALQENRMMKPVSVPRKKIFSYIEKAIYISLSAALLLLSVYAVVSLFS